MYVRKFKPFLFVAGKKSKQKYEDAVAMPLDEGKAFVEAIISDLTKLWSKPSGKALIQAISDSGKLVLIYKDDASGKGSAALPFPGTVENEIQRFIKMRQIPSAALQALVKRNPNAVTPSQKQYAAFIHSTIERSKVDRNILANIMGITRDKLDDIELGLEAMPSEAYHRFAMFLYPHLEPGNGSTVGLRIDTDQSGPDDPSEIILGHELVHVWRMVTGMRIFSGGWEEEAMTTGLAQFINMPFTENKLRLEHGYALRGKYTALCGTAHYMMTETFKGVWPEHVRAWEEWKKANPKLADKPIKLKKNSVFSNPVRNLFNR